MLDEILDYNRRFVEEHHYKPYETSKYPDRKIAILTCMDTRLTHLLPAAMGLKNGEVKLIKNAGGIVFPRMIPRCAASSSPFWNWAWRRFW